MSLAFGLAHPHWFQLSGKFNPLSLFSAGEQGIAVPDLTPGNGFLFQDSAGTTPVTAYEQPVGLILDRSKGLVLGSELRGTGTTTKIGTVTDATYNTATGAGTAVRVDALNQSGVTFTVTANAVYKITFTATSGDVRIRNGNFGGAQLAIALSGQTFTGYIYPTSASIFFAATSDGATANFTVTVLQLLPGNHIIQATSTKRPTLSARYNLLTYSETITNSAWLKDRVTVSGNTVTVNDVGNYASLAQSVGMVSGNKYVFRFSATAGTSTRLNTYYGGFNSTAARVISGPGSVGATGSGTVDVTNLGATPTVVEIEFVSSSTSTKTVAVYPGDWMAQSVGNSVSVTAFDLRRTIDTVGMPAYQRVGASNDYDTAGFFPYLAFDGTDDSMATAASVDFATVTSDGQARRNLLSFPTQFDVTSVWVPSVASVTANADTAPDGTLTADLLVGSGGGQRVTQSTTATATTNTFSVYVKQPTSGSFSGASLLIYNNTTAAAVGYALFTGATFTNTGTSGGTATSSNAGGGWYRVTFTITSGVSVGNTITGYIYSNNNTGSGSAASVLIWGAQLETGSTATAFQNIGTDKMTVFAGVTKLSDAATGQLFELSTSAATNNGSFLATAPNGAAANYGFSSRGTSTTSSNPTTYASPISNVLTNTSDISAPSLVFRINGAQVGSSTFTQGTGNYGNYQLFLGARDNASRFFNGRMYPFFIRGAATDATTIAQVEQYIRARMPVSF